MLPLLLIGTAALLLLSRQEGSSLGSRPIPTGPSGPLPSKPEGPQHITERDSFKVLTPEGVQFLKSRLKATTTCLYDKMNATGKADDFGGTVDLSPSKTPCRNPALQASQLVKSFADSAGSMASVWLMYPAAFTSGTVTIDNPVATVMVLGVNGAKEIFGPKVDNYRAAEQGMLVFVGNASTLKTAGFFS